jgi:hypothetical protein
VRPRDPRLDGRSFRGPASGRRPDSLACPVTEVWRQPVLQRSAVGRCRSVVPPSCHAARLWRCRRDFGCSRPPARMLSGALRAPHPALGWLIPVVVRAAASRAAAFAASEESAGALPRGSRYARGVPRHPALGWLIPVVVRAAASRVAGCLGSWNGSNRPEAIPAPRGRRSGRRRSGWSSRSRHRRCRR